MKTTEERINEIRAAQVISGELVVMKGLWEKGLMSDEEWEEVSGQKITRYRVYYNGKDTGIITKDTAIKLSELQKKVPDAQPWGDIEFKTE